VVKCVQLCYEVVGLNPTDDNVFAAIKFVFHLMGLMEDSCSGVDRIQPRVLKQCRPSWTPSGFQ
jgi:hypothetical protein